MTKVRFLNDACLRQMMLAAPMMTASPNDVWLRHILWQTSHHCGTKWSNIILSVAKNIISPQGDASFDTLTILRQQNISPKAIAFDFTVSEANDFTFISFPSRKKASHAGCLLMHILYLVMVAVEVAPSQAISAPRASAT